MQSLTKTGITGKTRETLAKILEHVVREEFSLCATTKDYRWNVTGPNLYSLHRLFDEQRRQLDYWLERIRERAKSIGFSSWANLAKKVQPSGRGAPSSAGLPAQTMVGDLLARHEGLAHRLREDIERLGDPATVDLLLHLAEFHETTAWMLRVINNGPGPSRAV
jgi:starvation-inducible DNA-binding protein